MREITVFDLVKHLELDNFCDLIFGAVNDIGTQEGLKAALQTEITKEELQRIIDKIRTIESIIDIERTTG